MPAEALRVVLFGLPSAGKSALLGALTQAAQVQESLLNGRIVNPPEAFAELHKNFADNRLQPTADDVTAYPLALEPLSGGSPLIAELVDCNGSRAAEMVNGQRPVQGWRSGALGKAIGGADALIVAADAAADAAQLQRDYGQLAGFLRLLQQSRGKRTEVAGLPVYLVLTKCDLLAKKTDTAAAWRQRVEERKRQVELSFNKYLAQQADREAAAFGKLELHVLATATRLPVLADRPGNPQEPYGVAELFRQSLQGAARFQEREDSCADRLKMTLFGTAGLVALMLALAVGVYATRPSAEVVALENELAGVLPSPEAPPADRLKEPLDKKLVRLHLIQKDPFYNQLPNSTRDEVASYVQEVETYQKFNKDFLEKVRDPRLATRAEDLAKIETQLNENPLPSEYASDWKDTRVGRRPDQWRNDLKILRAEVKQADAWIHEQIRKGRELEEEGLGLRKASPEAKKAWLNRYRQYLEQQWPHPPGTRPPGAAGVTYETAYRFDKVERARQVWDEFKQKRLAYVRQLLDEGS
jgi:hypothetical protein